VTPPPATPAAPTDPTVTPPVARVSAIRTAVRPGAVMIQVIASPGATVHLSAQRKVCKHRKCAWKTARRVSSPSGTIRLRLAPGRYRLRATAGTGPARYKQVTVRR
jgi:hypothetical protein